MIEKVNIETVGFKTSDGRVWSRIEDAEIHQLELDGKIKKCEACNGNGFYENEDGRGYIDCDYCKRKGYLTKQEVWK